MSFYDDGKIKIVKKKEITTVGIEFLKQYNITPVVILKNTGGDICSYEYHVIHTYDGVGKRPDDILFENIGLVSDFNILDLDGFLQELQSDGYEVIWKDENYKFNAHKINVNLSNNEKCETIKETTIDFTLRISYSELQNFCKIYPHDRVTSHDLLIHILTNHEEYNKITGNYKYHDNLKNIEYYYDSNGLIIKFNIVTTIKE